MRSAPLFAALLLLAGAADGLAPHPPSPPLPPPAPPPPAPSVWNCTGALAVDTGPQVWTGSYFTSSACAAFNVSCGDSCQNGCMMCMVRGCARGSSTGRHSPTPDPAGARAPIPHSLLTLATGRHADWAAQPVPVRHRLHQQRDRVPLRHCASAPSRATPPGPPAHPLPRCRSVSTPPTPATSSRWSATTRRPLPARRGPLRRSRSPPPSRRCLPPRTSAPAEA